MSETIERCIDGGECFEATENRLPPCTNSCGLRHAWNHADNWRNIERLAAQGWKPSIKIIERARNIVRA